MLSEIYEYASKARKGDMMILDQIKAANVKALKGKDTVARSLFSVILNKAKLEEIKNRERGLFDADIVQILQKTIKELIEEEENYAKVGNLNAVKDIRYQREVASGFLPQMMSREEIKKEIASLADRSVPSVMKHFKLNFIGKVDMREVSEVIKEIK